MATLITLPSAKFVECDFKPIRPRDTNRMESRKTESQTFGTPYWTASYRLGALTDVEQGLMRAFMMQAGDDGEIFAAYDAMRPRPVAYADGNYFPGENFSNLLVNPGFESGALTPWVNVTGASVVTGSGHSGTKMCLLDKGATGIGAGTQRQIVQVVDGIVPGKQYQLSAWLNSGGSVATAGASLSIEWRNAANAVISSSTVVANVGYGASWASVGGAAVAPIGAVRALTYALLGTTGALQTLLLDDLSFSRWETFVGNATLQSITNALNIVVSGVPAGFKLSLGDYVEIRKTPTVRSLHLITAAATANSSGVVTLSIKYALDLQTFTLPCTVHFEKPCCTMQIDPGSWQGPKSWAAREPSFSATEVFYS